MKYTVLVRLTQKDKSHLQLPNRVIEADSVEDALDQWLDDTNIVEHLQKVQGPINIGIMLPNIDVRKELSKRHKTP